MQLFVGDWLNDSRVTILSPATRGIWIDLLSHMHQLDRQGKVSGTSDQLARFARCSEHELIHALNELSTSGAADIQSREIESGNGQVTVKFTVINRRMAREHREREQTRKRVQKSRDKGKEAYKEEQKRKSNDTSNDTSNGVVTVHSSEFRVQNELPIHNAGAGGEPANNTDLDIEPTADPPCSKQEAKEYAHRIGMPDDVAELWWDRNHAYNWKPREGYQPITKRSWQVELRTYNLNRKHRDDERKRTAAARKAAPAKAGSTPTNPRNAHVSDAEKDLRKHRAQVKEITQHLEMLADDSRADSWPNVPDWRNSEYRDEAIEYLDERYPTVLQQLAKQGFLRHEPEAGWIVADDQSHREMERKVV